MSGVGVVADDAISWRREEVQVVLLTSLMGPLSASFISPVLPAIRDAFAVSDLQAGLVITVFAIPGVVLGPLIGMFADKFGRKRVLVFCLTVYGIAGAAIALTTDFTQLLALRFVQGCVGGSILIALSMTLVGDLFEGTSQNTMMGLTSAAIGIGAAVYPLFGGALADLAWQAPFLVYLASVGTAVFVRFRFDESEFEVEETELSYFRDAIEAVDLPSSTVVYTYSLLGFVIFVGGLLTTLPFLFKNVYEVGSTFTGMSITASLGMAFLVATQNGRLAERFSTRILLLFGMVCYGIGLGGAVLGSSPPEIVGAMVIFGVGHGMILPSGATAISRLGPARVRGSLMGLRTSTVLLGQAIGPVLFTFAAAVLSYVTVLAIASVVAFATGIAAFVFLSDFDAVTR